MPVHGLNCKAKVYCHPQGGRHLGAWGWFVPGGAGIAHCYSNLPRSRADRLKRISGSPCESQRQEWCLLWVKGQSSGRKQQYPFVLNLAHVSSRIRSEGLRDNITEQPMFELPPRKKISPHLTHTVVSYEEQDIKKTQQNWKKSWQKPVLVTRLPDFHTVTLSIKAHSVRENSPLSTERRQKKSPI